MVMAKEPFDHPGTESGATEAREWKNQIAHVEKNIQNKS